MDKQCPHCEMYGTFEDVADHMMRVHGYPGIWESEIPDKGEFTKKGA